SAGTNGMADALVGKRPGAGQEWRARDYYLPFRQHFEFLAPFAIFSRRKAGQAPRIAGQDCPCRGFDAHQATNDSRRQMVPVTDQAGPKLIGSQLLPDVVIMAR